MENAVERPVEPGVALPDGSFVFVRNPSHADLSRVHDLALAKIGPGVAALSVVESVYGHNPISVWGLYRSKDKRRVDPELIGLLSYLPLNASGLDALKRGTFDAARPDLALLAARGETPAALYLWAIVTRGTSQIAVKLVGHAIGIDLYARLPYFGIVATEQGLQALRRDPNALRPETASIGSLFELKFSPAYLQDMRAMKVHSAGRGPRTVMRPQLQTVLAANSDQIAKAFAIRSAVFLAEQGCPHDEEFDGNDFAGAHILGFVNGEPAAVLRIRYFAEFVKLERLAVLPRFRKTLIAKLVVEHAIALCRRKGYRKMYGHAQKRLVKLWERFGFRPMAKNTNLIFSDHEYVEMIGDIEPHQDPLTPNSDPYVLIRPEGKWDAPGVLDRSSSRPATNPH